MARFMNQVILIMLLLLVLLSPIPLASNRDWSWTLCAFLTSIITLLWLLNTIAGRRRPCFRLPWIIPALFLLALAWAWVQTQSWVPMEWKHPIWSLASEYLGSEISGAISLAPEDNYTALMRLLAYGLVFFLSFQLCRDRASARKVFWWVFIAGVIYALYGLLSYWGVLRDFMWYQDDAFGRDVRATFVNRNHFANWLGIVVVVSLAIFIDHMLRAPAYPMMALQGRQKRLDRFLARSWAPLAGLILLVSALVASHSRGGFIATFCGGAVLLLLIDRKQRTVSVRTRAVAVSALLVSAVAFFITSEVLLERFDGSEIDAHARSTIYTQVSQAIADNPVLGFGYGTFEDGFMLYRSEEIHKLVDFAHNTFLENLFELGIPAALALFGATLGLALVCLRGLSRRQRDWVFPATGIGATVLVAVHANLDFGLQMPAVAMLYALVMGVACAQSYSSASRHG